MAHVSTAAPQRHWQCVPGAMPPAQSKTYGGIMDEVAQFFHTLGSNKCLQEEFLSMLKAPDTDLMRLNQELRAVQEALATGSEPVELESFPGINSKLSAAPPLRLEEVKALTIATEAFRVLSVVTVGRILSLTTEERSNLFTLFKELPVSSSAHSFTRPPFSESDSLYFQLLRKIGFGNCQGHLVYETNCSGVDMITMAITAITVSSA